MFVLGIPEDLREQYKPVLDLTLFALTSILKNQHLQKNFSAHFIPFASYQYEFPVWQQCLEGTKYFYLFFLSVERYSSINLTTNRGSFHWRKSPTSGFSRRWRHVCHRRLFHLWSLQWPSIWSRRKQNLRKQRGEFDAPEKRYIYVAILVDE